MVVFFFARLHDEWFDYTQYKRAYDALNEVVRLVGKDMSWRICGL
jgi:hypothetical protein